MGIFKIITWKQTWQKQLQSPLPRYLENLSFGGDGNVLSWKKPISQIPSFSVPLAAGALRTYSSGQCDIGISSWGRCPFQMKRQKLTRRNPFAPSPFIPLSAWNADMRPGAQQAMLRLGGDPQQGEGFEPRVEQREEITWVPDGTTEPRAASPGHFVYEMSSVPELSEVSCLWFQLNGILTDMTHKHCLEHADFWEYLHRHIWEDTVLSVLRMWELHIVVSGRIIKWSPVSAPMEAASGQGRILWLEIPAWVLVYCRKKRVTEESLS